jgi:hypothetical protein
MLLFCNSINKGPFLGKTIIGTNSFLSKFWANNNNALSEPYKSED